MADVLAIGDDELDHKRKVGDRVLITLRSVQLLLHLCCTNPMVVVRLFKSAL